VRVEVLGRQPLDLYHDLLGVFWANLPQQRSPPTKSHLP
jgi:hypothetical protein